MGLTLCNPVYRLAHSELHRVDSGNKKVYNTAIVPQGREFNPTTVLEGQMQILKEAWEFRVAIGFVVCAFLAYFGWQELKKARASAHRSDQKFHAQTKVVPTEDLPSLGAEATLPSYLHKK
jgi:hypothetical protein